MGKIIESGWFYKRLRSGRWKKKTVGVLSKLQQVNLQEGDFYRGLGADMRTILERVLKK